jgi:rod shape-determining protein MreC
MRTTPVEPPPFFHRGPSPLTRLTFFGLLSIALMFADTRFGYLEGIRTAVAVVLYPLQRAVQVPGEAVAYVAGYFASKSDLEAENASLQASLTAQAPAAQGYPMIVDENKRLKALLDVQARYPGRATAVGVLYTGRDPFTQKLFIDKGGESGIKPGEAVIDEAGVVGQVTRVFPHMAEVTLVTDKDHAVPVKVERNGVRSVLYGAGAGRSPELRFMPPSADLQPGDRLLTSGLDGTYPAGLAVARVATVDRDTGQIFARITCAPMAGVDRSEHLLVIGQATALPARPSEPVEADTAKKGSRRSRRGG